MPATPWRIAAQSLVVLDPQTKEPAFTLQFIVDHGQADVARLRMVPADDRSDALEMEFTTGGFPISAPVRQPRWLKAFERPDPTLYLDDETAAIDHHRGLAPAQQDAWVSKRDALMKRREEWGSAHGRANGSPQQAGADTGPDSTDPNSPQAERARSAQAGLDTTMPGDEDRKGMITQPPGGMAGETASAAQSQQPNAPNAVDQQRQRQGEQVDTKRGQEQGASAG